MQGLIPLRNSTGSFYPGFVLSDTLGLFPGLVEAFTVFASPGFL